MTFNAGGRCVIDANQAGGGGFLAAPQVQRTLTVPVALAYAGPQSVSAGADLAPAATLLGTAGACRDGQPVTFTLGANPTTGAGGTYPLESAAISASGTATGAPVSTAGWQAGAYTITASYAGTGNCGAFIATAPLAVTTPGLAAAGAGSYRLNDGAVSFGFIVAQTPDTSRYGISLVSTNGWWLAGTVSSYVLKYHTLGSLTGTGSLYWWNKVPEQPPGRLAAGHVRDGLHRRLHRHH